MIAFLVKSICISAVIVTIFNLLEALPDGIFKNIGQGLILIILLVILIGFFYSAEVDFDRASNIAQNFYNSRNSNDISIESVRTIEDEGRTLIYISSDT